MEFLKIWEILVRRKWLIVSIILLFFLISVIGTHLAIPVYKSPTKVLIQTPEALTSLKSNLGIQSSSAMATSITNTYDTDIALAQIRPLLEGLISSLALKDRGGKPLNPDKLVSKTLLERIFPIPHLKISQYKETSIIEILAFSTNPSEAANMANKLAELYINNRIDMTRTEYTAARLVIESRLQKVREDYYNSLYAMKDFRIGHGVVDPSVEIQNLINKIVGLKNNYEENENLIQKYEVGTATAEQKLKELNMFTKQSELFTNDIVKSLKSRLNDLLIDMAAKSADITKEHPDYNRIEKQAAAIKELIMNDTKVFLSNEAYSVNPLFQSLTARLVENYIEREVAIAKKNLLNKYIDKYEAELLKIPVKSVETSKLELDINVNRNIYQKLLEFLTQVRVVESITLSKMKVVDAAVVPDKPEFPKKLRNYIISIFLGLFWGLSAAFFVEYIDNTIKSVEDIKHIKSLNLIGVVPRTKHLNDMGLISSIDPNSHIVETFRTIRNGIRYSSLDKPLKTIAITSSVESEGKSSLASNISIAFRSEGRRVILVDMDMRKASIHHFFNVSNRSGVTDVLAGGMQLGEAIVHSSIEGLDLLTSGPAPLDPGRMIDSPELRDVICTLHNSYDLVIIDTPPIMHVNDAIVIGRHTDGMLYVIESGKATFSMIEYGLSLIEKGGINVIGFVLNKIEAYPHYYPPYNKND